MRYINYRRTNKDYKASNRANELEMLYKGIAISEKSTTPDGKICTLLETEEHPFSKAIDFKEDPYPLKHSIYRAYQEAVVSATFNNNNAYHTFFIQKRNGKQRMIKAPTACLKDAHAAVLKQLYKQDILAHDAAHAFIPKHGTLTSLQKHQANKSKWFLKLDIKDFFPSLNIKFLYKQLKNNYKLDCAIPSAVLLKLLLSVCTLVNETDDDKITERLKEMYTFLDEQPNVTSLFDLDIADELALPQGSPLSPMLANLAMVLIDEEITQALRKLGPYCYTRYADDILISCPMHFDKTQMMRIVQTAFTNQEAPFTLKLEKTRYGSSAGRNWNLGLMYNKDNKITLGHKQNQKNKAMVNNFLRDFSNNNKWEPEQVHHMLGMLSYAKHIDTSYTGYVVKRLEDKYNLNFMGCVKDII